MAGPSIARAEVTVDLDGKSLPAKARALGEEAGREAGEAHNDAFSEEVDKGYGDLRKQQIGELRESGKLAGDGSGDEFTKAFRASLRSQAKDVNQDLVNIFSHNNGLDSFHEGLDKSGDDMLDIERTVQRVNELLHGAAENGSLNSDQLLALSRETSAWGANMKDVVKEYRDTRDISLDHLLDQGLTARKNAKDLADEAESIKTQFREVNEQRLTDFLDDLVSSRDETERVRGQVGGLSDDIDDLRHNHVMGLANDLEDIFETPKGGVREYIKGLSKEDFPTLSDAIEHVNGKLDAFDRATGSSATTEPFRKAVHDIGAEAETGAGELERLAGGIEKAGGSAGRNSGKFGGLGSALGKLGQFDPADNMGQLFALIIALAPQVATLAVAAGGGLVILAGGLAAIAAFGVGAFVGFSNLFGDITKLEPAVRPAATAIQDLAGPKGLGLLRDALQKPLLKGLAGEFDDLRTKTIPALEPAFATLGGAVNTVLTRWINDLQSSGFTSDFTSLMKGLDPAITGLGTVFSNVVGIIGQALKDVAPYTDNLVSDLEKATGKFLTFLKTPEGHDAVKQFFDDTTKTLGDVGKLFTSVGSALAKLVTPENVENTSKILQDLAKALPDLIKFGDSLSPIVGAASGAIKAIAGFAKSVGDFFGSILSAGDSFIIDFQFLLSGIIKAVGTFATGVGANFAAVGKAVQQAASGDFAGAAKTIAKAVDDSKESVKTLGSDFAEAVGNASADFDTLPKNVQGSLTTLAGHFNVSKGDVKEFGGTIDAVSLASGVSIGKISKAKGWDDLATITGLSKTKVDELRKQFEDASTKSSAALADLASKATAHLDTISSKLGLRGKDADTFSKAVIGATSDSKSALSELAGAKSWGDIYDALNKGGTASKTQFANKIIESANASGDSIDKLPAKIQGLINKYGDIPKNVKTEVELSGAASAISEAAAVGRALSALPNSKTINITQITKNIATGKAGGAIGGIISGGQYVAGARHFASGGILSSSTWLSPYALAGESGAEAIVPLARPLSQVDPSVRNLAAFAQGLNATTDKQKSGAYVAAGAVQIVTPASDPAVVATQVINRLVPLI